MPAVAEGLVDIGLRRATAADRPLFTRVFASTRADLLAAIPGDESMRTALLAQQFAAQNAYYATHFGDGDVSVIEIDGTGAGRLYVVRRDGDIRLVDIGLLPEHRGRGVGGLLLVDLLREADARGCSVSLHVERQGRARSLYHRLGFAEVSDDGVYVSMQRQPKTAS